MGAILDLGPGLNESAKKMFPDCFHMVSTPRAPFSRRKWIVRDLSSTIAQRRIRIFGKRFMESEMAVILVKVGEHFHMF